MYSILVLFMCRPINGLTEDNKLQILEHETVTWYRKKKTNFETVIKDLEIRQLSRWAWNTVTYALIRSRQRGILLCITEKGNFLRTEVRVIRHNKLKNAGKGGNLEEITHTPCLAAPENTAWFYSPMELISDFWPLELWAEKLQACGNLSWLAMVCCGSPRKPLWLITLYYNFPRDRKHLRCILVTIFSTKTKCLFF